MKNVISLKTTEIKLLTYLLAGFMQELSQPNNNNNNGNKNGAAALPEPKVGWGKGAM